MNFTAKVKNGKIVFDNPTAFAVYIQRFEGKEIEISAERASKRTLPQNKYYFGVVVQMVLDRLIDLGYQVCDLIQIAQDGGADQNLTAEDVHDFLKSKFNRVTVFSETNGEVLGTIGGSTKTLPPEEFTNYIERIRQWAAESLDIDIPNPDPKTAGELSYELKN